ncbi:hypothetical protein [Diaphorobacter caeni]|uniref:hypothetical protein n=1 Tax=Diaphorobacter caeni TaxID=2784387 RepID=UPI00188FA5E9|nr:hypothetical protein [Diaphorobacter caeni]MBF5007684.1 hypothetical protein [Diaphorobacter caeni]
MTQSLVVGLIVVAAVLYVLWRYMPQKWRNPLGKINPKLAQVSGCGSGCSSCDSPPGAGKSCGTSGGEFSDSKPVTLHGNIRSHMGDQH